MPITAAGGREQRPCPEQGGEVEPGPRHLAHKQGPGGSAVNGCHRCTVSAGAIREIPTGLDTLDTNIAARRSVVGARAHPLAVFTSELTVSDIMSLAPRAIPSLLASAALAAARVKVVVTEVRREHPQRSEWPGRCSWIAIICGVLLVDLVTGRHQHAHTAANKDVDHRSRPQPCQCPCCTGARPAAQSPEEADGHPNKDAGQSRPRVLLRPTTTRSRQGWRRRGWLHRGLPHRRRDQTRPGPQSGCEVVMNISHIAACVTQDSPESTGPQMLHSYTPQKPTRQRQGLPGQQTWRHHCRC